MNMDESHDRMEASLEKLKEAAAELLQNEFPFVESMDEMESLADCIGSALILFSSLCEKIADDLLNEAYDGFISKIQEHLNKADGIIARLKRILPKNFSNDLNIDAVAVKVKLMSEILDTGFRESNLSIYELIDSDKWTTEVPPECKTLYMDLIEKFSLFCVFALGFNSEYANVIPKTKTIFGKQMCPKAKAPSVTEFNRTFEWVTYEQFRFGLKSTDLKKMKAAS